MPCCASVQQTIASSAPPKRSRPKRAHTRGFCYDHLWVSDTGRQKTVVTAISKISDRPVGKEACLVVIYGMELGKKFNLNRSQFIIGRSSKADIQIDQESVSRTHCKIINAGKEVV